jgi:hypothetical protein
MSQDVCVKCRRFKEVKLRADDLLCGECDADNERQLAKIRSSRQGNASSITPTTDKPHSLPDSRSNTAKSSTAKLTVTTAATEANLRTSTIAPGEGKTIDIIIFSKLLAYVKYYRDNSTTANLHKTVLNYYAATEIADANKQLINTFSPAIPPDCISRTERRKSSTRSTHDAEAKYIIGLFILLYRQKALDSNVKFAALAVDRIPKYAPEETNIATMVDKQVHLESLISDLESNIDSICSSVTSNAQSENFDSIRNSLAHFDDQLRKSMNNIDGQLTQFFTICRQLAESVHPAVSNGARSPENIDKSRNVIISGITEDATKTFGSQLLYSTRTVDCSWSRGAGRRGLPYWRPIHIRSESPSAGKTPVGVGSPNNHVRSPKAGKRRRFPRSSLYQRRRTVRNTSEKHT